jgi:ribosomal protein S27E
MEHYFSVSEVREAECTLEPMKCIYCESLEVTFNQYVNDAYCAECGEWQSEN